MYSLNNLIKEDFSKRICIIAFAIGKKDIFGSAIHSIQHIENIASQVKSCIVICPLNFRLILKDKLSKKVYNKIKFLKKFEKFLNNCPILLKPIFTGFILPIFFYNKILIYLDDSGALIPFTKSLVLIHNPISLYKIKELIERKIAYKLSFIIIFKVYLNLSNLISNPKYLVQSVNAQSLLMKRLKLEKYKTNVINIYDYSRKFYPNLRRDFTNSLLKKKNLEVRNLDSVFKKNFKKYILVPISPRPQKNFQLVIRMAMRIEDCLFIVTSDHKTYYEYLNTMNIKNNINNIHCTGIVSHNNVCNYMNHEKLKLVFFPSQLETFGLPILEAYLINKFVLIPNDSIYDVHDFKKCFRYENKDDQSCYEKMLNILDS